MKDRPLYLRHPMKHQDWRLTPKYGVICALSEVRKDPSTIPEWDTCEKLEIEAIFGVGQPKFWSSSDFLKRWGDYASKG